MSAFSKIFGSHSERELKRIYPIADKVESYKEAMGKLSDEELKDKTREFKKRLEDGATLDDLLPEAFATVREAAKRVLGMEHYRVQIIGGIILQTISYNNDFIQCFCIVFQYYFERSLIPHLYFLCYISYIRNTERCVGRQVNCKISINVGNSTVSCVSFF